MARLQNLKRQRADEALSQDHLESARPTKKNRTLSEIEDDKRLNWVYPPKFWDGLSKVLLTRNALKELDRRTKTRRRRPSPPPTLWTTSPGRVPARFARHGGPDLRHLRSCPEPIKWHSAAAAAMSSRSQSRRTGSTNQPSTLPTSGTAKTKKSGLYDRGFDIHLTDHHVHPTYPSRKPDLTDMRTALAVPRPSLTPSRFSEGAFERFQENNALAEDEADVVANVIPTILGSNQPATARNTWFGNLAPLTDGTIPAAKPDIYYGSNPLELSRSVRNELSHDIGPSTMQNKPLAPNFFVEVKGPDGSAAVATRQARYDGAVGTRAMHSLQNYGQEELEYDGNPYTFSSTYLDGTLKIYTHYITAPTTEGGRPEYHMAQVRGFNMTDSRDTFAEGAGAFRNAVSLAQGHRDRFIQAANTRAQAPQITETAYHGEADSPNKFFDCEDYTAGDAANQADHGSDAPGSLCDQDNSQPLRQPSVTDLGPVASSFTESSRSRRRLSPPSSDSGTKSSKSQKRSDTSVSRRIAATSPDEAEDDSQGVGSGIGA
ncbi:hypothetical protein F66182_7545 [Fusarium sp. NRRL 66182]|nr:hypothetical protein F66182_7545 [Fusarium sp. NRRL 66182]